MTATETLKAKAATQSTDTLMGALVILDAKDTRDEQERMVYAAMADVIEERHGLTDAMDTIYGDESYIGTYADALLIALAAVTA